MGNNRTVSSGTVIGIGFIILGVINLFGLLSYKRTFIHNSGRIPGMLFIGVGLIIIIIHAIRKKNE